MIKAGSTPKMGKKKKKKNSGHTSSSSSSLSRGSSDSVAATPADGADGASLQRAALIAANEGVHFPERRGVFEVSLDWSYLECVHNDPSSSSSWHCLRGRCHAPCVVRRWDPSSLTDGGGGGAGGGDGGEIGNRVACIGARANTLIPVRVQREQQQAPDHVAPNRVVIRVLEVKSGLQWHYGTQWTFKVAREPVEIDPAQSGGLRVVENTFLIEFKVGSGSFTPVLLNLELMCGDSYDCLPLLLCSEVLLPAEVRLPADRDSASDNEEMWAALRRDSGFGLHLDQGSSDEDEDFLHDLTIGPAEAPIATTDGAAYASPGTPASLNVDIDGGRQSSWPITSAGDASVLAENVSAAAAGDTPARTAARRGGGRRRRSQSEHGGQSQAARGHPPGRVHSQARRNSDVNYIPVRAARARGSTGPIDRGAQPPTPSDADLVQESFQRASRNPRALSAIMHATLASESPDTARLFSDCPEGLRRFSALRLGQTVVAAARGSLSREELWALTRRHVGYGVSDRSDFRGLGAAFVAGVAGAAGHWNGQLQAAWTAAFDRVAERMVALLATMSADAGAGVYADYVDLVATTTTPVCSGAAGETKLKPAGQADDGHGSDGVASSSSSRSKRAIPSAAELAALPLNRRPSYFQLDQNASPEVAAVRYDLEERMLLAISAAHAEAVRTQPNINVFSLFDRLKECACEVTDSAFAFAGEIKRDEEGVFLHTYALTDISWNAKTRRLYQENTHRGFKFRNMSTLFGACVVSRKAVISNCPANDPRSGGLPRGHPALTAFAGIPLFGPNKQILGMLGLANRAGGYTPELVEFITPLLSCMSSILHSVRQQRERYDRLQRIDDILSELRLSVDQLRGCLGGGEPSAPGAAQSRLADAELLLSKMNSSLFRAQILTTRSANITGYDPQEQPHTPEEPRRHKKKQSK